MSLVPRQRKRTSTPRSRTGCLTCRQRRIKCDEQRPQCQNCSRHKLTCELSVEAIDPRDLARTLLISAYTLPFSVPGSADDRRALHFYFTRNQSYHSLGCAAGFWCTLVPQRCQHESVLRHTLVAFSRALLYQSATEPNEDLDPSEPLHDAIEANGRAIRALRRYIDRSTTPDPVVILSCCILLVSVSQLLGLSDAAVLHLDHAITLFNSWHGQNLDFMPSKERRIMHTMLGVMDALVFIQQPSYIPKIRLESYLRPKLCKADLVSRTSFDTLDDVYCHGLLTSYLPITHFLAQNADLRDKAHACVPKSILEEQALLMRDAKRWDAAARGFEREHYKDSLTSSDPARLLKHMGIVTSLAHNFIAKRMLANGVPQCCPNPPIWDHDAGDLFELARRYCVLKTQFRAIDKNEINLGGWRPNNVHIKQCLDTLAERTNLPEIRVTALGLGRETAT